MPSKGIGRWKLLIGEHGICMKRKLEFAGYDWKDYNYLAEAENTFYFVNTGAGCEIECIPIPKWMFKDHREVDTPLNFYRGRGVK